MFRDLVLARVIEPTSKLVSLRVLSEAGIDTSCYATLKRRLPAYAEWSWRQDLAGLPRSEPNLVRACLCQHARPQQRWASPATLHGAAYSRHAQVLLGVIVPTPDEAAPRARRGCQGRRLRT